MAVQQIDFTNDFAIEREWVAQPATLPHWAKLSPEDPTAADRTDYIFTLALGTRARFGLQNLAGGFGQVASFEYQFAFLGVPSDNIPGLLLEFLIAPGVVVSTAGPFNVSGDSVGQAVFAFSPPLTEAEFATGSIRHTAADGASGGAPSGPNFSTD